MSDDQAPTRAQVYATLAAADALPEGAWYLNYGASDLAAYEKALDVLAAVGWLGDPTDEKTVSAYGNHEVVMVGGIGLSSPVGHKPFTTSAAVATPIEKLAEPPSGPLLLRVEGVEIELEGPGAGVIRELVRRALPERAGTPLASREASVDDNVVHLHSRGRGELVRPNGDGA